MQWTDELVRRALGLPGPAGSPARYTAIASDTRTLGRGALFVALPGERFDGHQFLDAARRAGAAGAVVCRETPPVAGLLLYHVDDTLWAYGRLGRERRRAVSGPVVAITGTNGKTSTKEMLAAALRTRYRVHATRLNLNNLVGVPQSILEAPEDTEALVIEAGANLPGEMAQHREIIEPTISVVTNVGPGHLEGFGSLEGVLTEKLELTRDVELAVVGTEPPVLAERARRLARRVVTAGLKGADVTPDRCEVLPTGRSRVRVRAIEFTLRPLGRHQAANAMLAWAVAQALDLALEQVARALESFSIPSGRGELVELGGLTILDDSYNANPASFRAAIDLAAELKGGGRRLVFVAGTMRELGPEGARLHAEIAERLVGLGPELLAAVGEFGPALEPYRARLGDRLLTAPDAPTMGPRLAARLKGDELVVLKGSRGVALERMLPDLVGRQPS